MTSSPPIGPRHTVETAGKCPVCGSRLRADETWCSLCHTAVPSAEFVDGLEQHQYHQPEQPGPPERPGQGAADESPAAVAPGLVPDPPAAAQSSEPDPAVAAVAEQLLAELAAAEARRERESGIGSLRLRLRLAGRSGRSTAILVAAIGGTLLLIVTILGLTLLGLLV